jgi:hypothetical protein
VAKKESPFVIDSADENLDEFCVEAEFNLNVHWLRRKRRRGTAGDGDPGPPFIKAGRKVLYRRGDVRSYLDSRRVDRSQNALPGSAAYIARADQHKPTGQPLQGEIHRLSKGGLTPRDIAVALRLDLPAVVEVLGPPAAQPASTTRASPLKQASKARKRRAA